MITKTYRIVTETNNDGTQVKKLYAPHFDGKEDFVIIKNDITSVSEEAANFRLVCGDYIAKRITSLDEALILSQSNSVCFWSFLEDNWADDVRPYDEDENELEQTDYTFYSTIVEEFNEYGYIFVSFLLSRGDRLGDDKRFKIAVIDSNEEYITKPSNGNVYFSKYKAGTNMFYHTDTGKKQLNVGKINEIVIRQKAGYQPSVTYNMTNGNSVPEGLMATPDMAHEWIKSNS